MPKQRTKEMTQKEYLDAGGNVCPACGSKRISAGNCNHEPPATQDVVCDDCGATWKDLYQLISYENLQRP